MNYIVLGIALIVLMVIVGPYFSISAINALFGTAIEFNLVNWASMAWLHIVIASGRSKSSDK